MGGSILLAVLFKRYLSRYIAGLLYRIIHKLASGVDKKSFVNLVVSPLETFLLLLVVIVSLDKLNFPQLFNINLYKILAAWPDRWDCYHCHDRCFQLAAVADH